MKKISILFGVLVVVGTLVCGVLYANRSAIAKSRLGDFLVKLTGTKVEIGSVELRGMSVMLVQQIKIQNLPAYQQQPLAVLTNVEIHFNGWDYLLGKSVHFERISASLDEVILERNFKGDLNLRDLSVFSDVKSGPSALPQFVIDRFEMSFGKAILYESVPDKDALKTDVQFGGRKEVYANVTDPRVLIYAPALKIVPEFRRGNMGIPRTDIQKKIAETSGFQRS